MPRGRAAADVVPTCTPPRRAQFVQVVVKAAVMLYILSGKITDVSTALYTFFVSDLVPRADPTFFTPPNISCAPPPPPRAQPHARRRPLVLVLVRRRDALLVATGGRRNTYYVEAVDKVLRHHEATLRNVFDATCVLGGRSVAGGCARRTCTARRQPHPDRPAFCEDPAHTPTCLWLWLVLCRRSTCGGAPAAWQARQSTGGLHRMD